MHTHSTYASAWAARGEPIPCVLTAMADEFGGDDPGRPVRADRRRRHRPGHRRDAARSRSPAVLMQNHGVFTIGRHARAAVKAAVMCEDVARTVHLARQLGEPLPIAPGGHRPALRPLPERLRPALTRQSSPMERLTVPYDGHEIWFLTGSQGAVRRGHAAAGRRAVAARSPTPLDAADGDPGPDRVEAGAHRRRRDPPGLPGRQRRRRLRRRHRLDAHVLPGQDVDRRPGRAAQAAAAPAHPGQRRAAVGRDRHGLHEPQPGRARRPRVRLHPDPAGRRRARPSPGTSSDPRGGRADRRVGAGRGRRPPRPRRCGWPGSATTCATSPSPRATRSRPQLRFGVSVNTYGVNDLVDAGRRGRRRGRRRSWSTEYDDPYDVGRRAARRRRAARVAALRRPHRARAARASSTDGGFGAFTTNFEDLGGLRQLPGPRRAAADGRRLRLRRRGRLEDLGRCCACSRSMAAGLPGGTSFMEDYTYHLGPGEPKILGAHMLEVCPTIAARHAEPARSTRWASAAGRTRSGWCSTPAPGPGVRRRAGRPGRPVPAGRQRDRRRAAGRAAARSCRSPARSGSRGRTWPTVGRGAG